LSHIYEYPGAHDRETYDLENAIADPDHQIESFMESLVPFEGIVLADIGAGGGYHACRYAQKAARVFAVEPCPAMLRQLYARLTESDRTNISVLAAGAEGVPLRDNLADVVHSRFAYFFGPPQGVVRSCEPGIAEALRILKAGGFFFIIDNAFTSGQFGALLGRYGYVRGEAVEAQRRNDEFYAGHGFQHTTVQSKWAAPDRAALRRIMAMEFPADTVEAIMAEIEGTELTYHYRVYYRRK
jgi:SAM-dependent methyltransferase